jgi:ABC-type Fe3+-siderophore transport system permease subunit
MNSHDSKINTVPFLFVLFGVLLILFLILNITLGSVKIPLGEIWESFMQRGDPVFQTVIMQIRFPRALAAVFGGAALAVSGLLLQIFFRNPIADPYVLGVSSGATLFVAIVTLTGCAIGIDSVSPFLLSSAALVSADVLVVIGSSLTVYPLAGFIGEYCASRKTFIIINKGPTALDHLSTVKLETNHTGDALEKIYNHLDIPEGI